MMKKEKVILHDLHRGSDLVSLILLFFKVQTRMMASTVRTAQRFISPVAPVMSPFTPPNNR
jgi:hypothetical protein